MAVTPYLRLQKPPFDSIPWDQAINGDMDIIDAFIAQYMAVPNFAGAWTNSTPYVVGQVLLDTSNSSMWIAQVSHTSAVTPTTFAQDRTAHPTYWAAGTTPLGMLPITGGTLTGNLTISPSSSQAMLALSSVSGNAKVVVGYTGSAGRWVIQLGNGVAETGSNAGADFTIDRYTDAGTYINSPIAISRATGVIGLNGNVTVNGTVTATDIYTNGLHVNGGGAFYSDATYTYMFQDSAGWRWQYNRSNGTMAYVRGSDAVTLLSIDSSGNLSIAGATASKPGGGAWTAPSDARIKDVLGDYTTGLDAVMALHPVHYKLKAGGREHIGLVAQEAEQVMPEMVSQISDTYDGVQIDDLRVLDMTSLPLALVNAMKELVARIEKLEAQLADRATQP